MYVIGPALVMAAEGEPMPTVGGVVSARTPVVLGVEKVKMALLPAASVMVPPFRLMGENTARAPLSPACTV